MTDQSIPAEKLCTKCRLIKPANKFGRNPTKRLGLDSWCMQCKNERRRERLGRKIRAYRQAGVTEKPCHVCKAIKPISEFWTDNSRPDLTTYYCKECGKPMARNAVRGFQFLKRTLKRRYNLSLEDYEAMLITQSNQCAICGQDLASFSYRPSVDHCHRTGHIRGILCRKCNTGLGCFNDSPETMLQAIEYLKRHG